MLSLSVGCGEARPPGTHCGCQAGLALKWSPFTPRGEEEASTSLGLAARRSEEGVAAAVDTIGEHRLQLVAVLAGAFRLSVALHSQGKGLAFDIRPCM